jgi:hypothetical protein
MYAVNGRESFMSSVYRSGSGSGGGTVGSAHRQASDRKLSEGSTSSSSSANPPLQRRKWSSSRSDEEIAASGLVRVASSRALGGPTSSSSTSTSTSAPPARNPAVPIKVSEYDTEAASSLLGFFNHLERNSSQEDMLHFFEGVRKNAAAATVVTSSAGPQSTPSPKASSAKPSDFFADNP